MALTLPSMPRNTLLHTPALGLAYWGAGEIPDGPLSSSAGLVAHFQQKAQRSVLL